MPGMTIASSSDKKKQKKEKQAAKEDAEAATPVKAEKSKKRKSESSEKKPKKKKAVGEDAPVAAEPAVEDADSPAPAASAEPVDENALDNFEMSDSIKSLLRSKGIKSLFPIQTQTYALAVDGNDVVGRARTGCGKTLAFVLPVIESMIRSQGTARRAYGRLPSVIVLAPTRELAKQVRPLLAS